MLSIALIKATIKETLREAFIRLTRPNQSVIEGSRRGSPCRTRIEAEDTKGTLIIALLSLVFIQLRASCLDMTTLTVGCLPLSVINQDNAPLVCLQANVMESFSQRGSLFPCDSRLSS